MSPSRQGEGTENILSERYEYAVKEGRYASYARGKVISQDIVGEAVESVSVTAGWVRYYGIRRDSYLTNETLRGTIYKINGVPEEAAVCIRFLDKGDAVDTEHYYVLINPDPDPNVKVEAFDLTGYIISDPDPLDEYLE